MRKAKTLDQECQKPFQQASNSHPRLFHRFWVRFQSLLLGCGKGLHEGLGLISANFSYPLMKSKMLQPCSLFKPFYVRHIHLHQIQHPRAVQFHKLSQILSNLTFGTHDILLPRLTEEMTN